MKKHEKKENQEQNIENNEETKNNNPFAQKENPVEEQQEAIVEEIIEDQNDEALTKLKADYDGLHNQYLRLAADFDNYRKRQAQEREQLVQYGTHEALKKMIDVLDNFDRAAQSCQKLDDIEKVKECFGVLEKQTKDVLIKIGLTEINTEGAEFDPNFHEAIMQTPSSEYKENEIINPSGSK